ncbi:MAG: hypothetical protein HZA51_12180 [Planctomycetes bacterium]|nr:hypothetical protein [Planctomycetota bacterium]
MTRAIELAKRIASGRPDEWTVRANHISVCFPSLDRKQSVYITASENEIVLTSTVQKAGDIKSAANRRRLARMAWRRNADHDLITFAFDAVNNLVGLVRHPRSTLDPAELELYVDTLARECDRFEHVLMGEDSQ